MLPRECIEQVLRGDDVRSHVPRGFGDRSAHPGHPRQVDDDVGARASREALRRAGGGQIHHVQFESLVVQSRLDVGDLEARIVVVVE